MDGYRAHGPHDRHDPDSLRLSEALELASVEEILREFGLEGVIRDPLLFAFTVSAGLALLLAIILLRNRGSRVDVGLLRTDLSNKIRDTRSLLRRMREGDVPVSTKQLAHMIYANSDDDQLEFNTMVELVIAIGDKAPLLQSVLDGGDLWSEATEEEKRLQELRDEVVERLDELYALEDIVEARKGPKKK